MDEAKGLVVQKQTPRRFNKEGREDGPKPMQIRRGVIEARAYKQGAQDQIKPFRVIQSLNLHKEGNVRCPRA